MSKKYIVQDSLFKKAKKDGYRARSAYKLLEIDNKFKIFKYGQNVLDLGAAPGSWLQVAAEKTNGRVIGVDLKEMEPLKDTITLACDVFSEEFNIHMKNCNVTEFDVILSDMAPKTTGISDVDQYASVELNLEALSIMDKYLKTGGWGVFKIFRGEDFNDFWFEAKKAFPKMKTFKPKACRDRSFELYCVGKKGG